MADDEDYFKRRALKHIELQEVEAIISEALNKKFKYPQSCSILNIEFDDEYNVTKVLLKFERE